MRIDNLLGVTGYRFNMFRTWKCVKKEISLNEL